MRILFVTNLINSGGVAKVVLNYAADCCSIKGYQCDILTYEFPSSETQVLLDKYGICAHVVPRFTRRPFKYKKLLKELLNKNNYDVLHAHLDYFDWIPCKIAKKANVQTIVGHAHGQAAKKNNFLFRGVCKIGRKLNKKYCDIRLACSFPSGKFVFGDSFRFIPNYINEDSIKLINYEKIKEYNREFCITNRDDLIVIGYMGYLGLQKNPLLGLKAVEELHKKRQDFIYLIAGDGVESEQINKYIFDHSMSDFVKMIGYRIDNILLMQFFDLLLMPSFSEGMSIALIEAQLFGLKCIVTPGVPKTNDLEMGTFYISSSYSQYDFSATIEDAISKEPPNLSITDRLNSLRKKGYDSRSVIDYLDDLYNYGEQVKDKYLMGVANEL